MARCGAVARFVQRGPPGHVPALACLNRHQPSPKHDPSGPCQSDHAQTLSAPPPPSSPKCSIPGTQPLLPLATAMPAVAYPPPLPGPSHHAVSPPSPPPSSGSPPPLVPPPLGPHPVQGLQRHLALRRQDGQVLGLLPVLGPALVLEGRG